MSSNPLSLFRSPPLSLHPRIRHHRCHLKTHQNPWEMSHQRLQLVMRPERPRCLRQRRPSRQSCPPGRVTSRSNLPTGRCPLRRRRRPERTGRLGQPCFVSSSTFNHSFNLITITFYDGFCTSKCHCFAVFLYHSISFVALHGPRQRPTLWTRHPHPWRQEQHR